MERLIVNFRYGNQGSPYDPLLLIIFVIFFLKRYYMLGYCVKCKKKTEIVNGKISKTKNGRNMMKGVCKICGTKENVFLKKTS